MTVKKILLLSSLVIFISCSDKPSSKFKHSGPDTIRTLVLYKYKPTEIRYDIFFRVSKDSFMFSLVDSNTFKKSWTRAKEYYMPALDTIKDASGAPILDSLNRPRIRTEYFLINSVAIIKDLDINIDSVIKSNKK